MNITMYESQLCGFCRAARRLLDKKGWSYESIIVDGRAEVFDEMASRSGRDTVPQIFFGEEHIGGFDDLAELDALGELDAMYSPPAP